jgi:hypothetical protein
LWPLGLAALSLVAVPFAVARAQSVAKQAPVPTSPAVAGWDEFVESLRTLPDRMLAKLPEEMRSDPQVQQEVARLALESLSSSSLEAIGGDGDFPQFLPTIGMIWNVGQPNADTIYKTTRVTPGASYRITGRKGTTNLAIIAQVVPRSMVANWGRPELDLNKVKGDAQGRYSVLVSETKPAGYDGDWWELSPQANRMLMRFVSSDWGKEVEPTVTIERIDKPMGRGRVTAADLEARLKALPQQVDMMALLFVDHVAKLRAEGFVNQLKIMTPQGALGGQFYYEGVYDLKDDEALIIDSPVPTTCHYRSLILTNELYETTNWYDNHSSLNADQAAPDADGRLRIVVSARDPGVKNWLDTAGYPKGMIQGRWTGCDSQPIPQVTKIKVSEAKKLLRGAKTVTPQEREQIIRERRRQLLERPLW